MVENISIMYVSFFLTAMMWRKIRFSRMRSEGSGGGDMFPRRCVLCLEPFESAPKWGPMALPMAIAATVVTFGGFKRRVTSLRVACRCGMSLWHPVWHSIWHSFWHVTAVDLEEGRKSHTLETLTWQAEKTNNYIKQKMKRLSSLINKHIYIATCVMVGWCFFSLWRNSQERHPWILQGLSCQREPISALCRRSGLQHRGRNPALPGIVHWNNGTNHLYIGEMSKK